MARTEDRTMPFSNLDLIALAWFVAAWGGYAADAPSRSAHGGHAGDGDAGERYGLLRLYLAACDRRRADHPPLARRNAERARDAAVRRSDHAARMGIQGRRPRGDLRLRVLQVRLDVSAVQLRCGPSRRDAIRCRPR